MMLAGLGQLQNELWVGELRGVEVGVDRVVRVEEDEVVMDSFLHIFGVLTRSHCIVN